MEGDSREKRKQENNPPPALVAPPRKTEARAAARKLGFPGPFLDNPSTRIFHLLRNTGGCCPQPEDAGLKPVLMPTHPRCRHHRPACSPAGCIHGPPLLPSSILCPLSPAPLCPALFCLLCPALGSLASAARSQSHLCHRHSGLPA